MCVNINLSILALMRYCDARLWVCAAPQPRGPLEAAAGEAPALAAGASGSSDDLWPVAEDS